MNLELIKSKFEAKSYMTRSDFIEEYHFKDNYHEYYKMFIVDNIHKIRNRVYLSDLIDLASNLSFFDNNIYELIKILLFQKNHLVVKISVISYLEMRTEYLKNNDALENLLQPLLQTKLPRFLRNQILVSLLEYGNSISKKDYLKALIASIQITNDWRSMHRILYNLKNYTIPTDYMDIIVAVINDMHQQINFGKGVAQLLGQYHVKN